MKIATRQLAQHLKKGLAPLYAVHGAETLLALEAGDAIRAAARRSGCAEREVFHAEPGADWSKLGASAANLSLFSTRRILEIRIPTGKPGADGGKALEAICARLPDDTVVLVMLPELEWQQLKTAWFNALEGAGTVVEARAVSREELPQWLAERLARQRQHASVETLEWMADRVEGNLLAAKQEVEKLALLLPEGEITLEAIRDAVTDVSRFERDALVDAIHAGEPGRIARAVDSLEAEGEPLPLLLWALAEELRLMMALNGGERPRRFLDPDRLQRAQRTARLHDAASFDRQLLRAHRIDRMIKGVETGDAWEEIL
ncbi:MAG TPA: DNA polymerase III subunit delta, partial [Usitatibacteraceae bacterium]|nr:DNA polymerase III subunit delta [Usitatibacteraceae bacterium]